MNNSLSQVRDAGGKPLVCNRSKRFITNAFFGMLIFIVCEVMFFGGLISAFLVGRAGQDWPPIGQPRLPIWSTLVNTILLLISGVFVFRSGKSIAVVKKEWLLFGLLLGLMFLLLQGMEWIRLMDYGLTMRSSNYGSFFYLVIGVHALHLVAAIILLSHVCYRAICGELSQGELEASRMFWSFVVCVWPILYVIMYL